MNGRDKVIEQLRDFAGSLEREDQALFIRQCVKWLSDEVVPATLPVGINRYATPAIRDSSDCNQDTDPVDEIPTERTQMPDGASSGRTRTISTGEAIAQDFDAESPWIDIVRLSGARLGPFELKNKIGEGGMGTVYLAEQKEPVRRKVAIKMIQVARITDEALQRFKLERQSLAKMNHPCIAHLLEAGQTPDGHPYFVMEYVEGMPVTQYCQEFRSTLRDRINLVLAICDAIQHAHQRGILHRDIKPGNILVSPGPEGTRPTVKVIDFGLAKLIDENDQTRFHETGAGQILGTIRYMSPEQAGGNAGQVDTRTDVYSLAAVLYELLTGMPTLDLSKLRGASLPEVVRVIQNESVPLMSARLREPEPDSLAKISLTQDQLSGYIRELTGDLDLILAKGLMKDVGQRYQSVGEFAEDLRRHLVHLPILARKPSAWYIASRFTVRNKLLVTAVMGVTTAVIGLLIAGIVKANSDLAMAANAAEKKEFQLKADIDAEKNRATEAELKSAKRDRIMSELVGKSNTGRDATEAKLNSLNEALQQDVMDDDSRCALQFARIETLYSMQRFAETRELLKTVKPRSLEHRALEKFWLVRMSPGLIDERASASELLSSELADHLPDEYRLLTKVLTMTSRAEAIPALEELLDKYPRSVSARKLLMACLLFDGRHAEVREQAALVRVLVDQEPETEVAVALSLTLEGRRDEIAPQLERLRGMLAEGDINRLNSTFDLMSRTSMLLTQWDTGALAPMEFLKVAWEIGGILESFSEDDSLLDEGLSELGRGLGMQGVVSESSTSGKLVYFGGRFAAVSAMLLIGQSGPFRTMLDEMADASPFENDAIFPFLKAVTRLPKGEFAEAIPELEEAERAPSIYSQVKPEVLYCLSMCYAGKYSQTDDPSDLRASSDAAKRWVAVASDFHGGRVPFLVNNLLAGGEFETSLIAIQRASQMYPEAQQTWDDLRLKALTVAGRETEAVNFADQILKQPEVSAERVVQTEFWRKRAIDAVHRLIAVEDRSDEVTSEPAAEVPVPKAVPSTP
ncbi:MAG: serine/threonine protein kinase [Planctomyces sp.]|nr:serine/threonine protein kinase [Planctomyces sp.]